MDKQLTHILSQLDLFIFFSATSEVRCTCSRHRPCSVPETVGRHSFGGREQFLDVEHKSENKLHSSQPMKREILNSIH